MGMYIVNASSTFHNSFHLVFFIFINTVTLKMIKVSKSNKYKTVCKRHCHNLNKTKNKTLWKSSTTTCKTT